MYTSCGNTSPFTTGTPRSKVAVAWVAESTTTELASTSKKEAEAVKSAMSKLVPVKTMVLAVDEVDSTAGKAEAASYS